MKKEDILKNGLPSITGGNKLYNAAATGAVTLNGLEQAITTQTYVVADVIETKYYELLGQKLSDFIKFDIGQGAYNFNLFQYTSQYNGGDFEEGLISVTSGLQANAKVDTEFGGFQIRNYFWRKSYTVGHEELEAAARGVLPISLIEQKEKSRKKNWDLGIQKVTFLGLDSGAMKGLVNQSNVTVNTSLLPVKVTAMTSAQVKAFASSVVSAFLANNNSTQLPNKWLMPTNEFVGLGVAVDPTYPLKTLRMQLEEAFRDAGCVDFKIVHSTYNNTADSSGTKGRHVFYYDNADTLRFVMPQDYTPYALYPLNGIDSVSLATGQFAGVIVYRPQEMLYADVQA